MPQEPFRQFVCNVCSEIINTPEEGYLEWLTNSESENPAQWWYHSFRIRLEVWNPGTLPPSLTLEMLRHPHGSVPGNPLVAEPLYLAQYIERMGTGTGDMIRRCRKAGLPEPEFSLMDGFVTIIRRKTGEVTGEVTGVVTGEVGVQPESQPESQLESQPESQPVSQPESLELRVLRLLINIPLSKIDISQRLGQRGISGHLNQVIGFMLVDRTIEYTIPDKPKSSKQRYRLTEKGITLLASLRKGPGLQ